MSRYLVDRLERAGDVELHLNATVRELEGGVRLDAIVVEDNQTGERSTLPARALFVLIGVEPHTRWLAGQLALDDHDFVLVGADAASSGSPGSRRDLGREPLMFETSRRGVFAVGDLRSGSIKRVASAVGEGSMVVRVVHDYLEEVGGMISR